MLRAILICAAVLLMMNPVLADEMGEDGYFDSDGVRLHFVTAGKGPLVVMLHGFPDFSYTWRDQMPALAGHFQVVALDLRGYNKSDQPEGVENYAMDKLTADVASVVKHFKQEKATVVGHDWGGAVAWAFAMNHPEMTERLVILNLPHPKGLMRELASNPEQQKNSQYARTFQQPGAAALVRPELLVTWVKDADDRKVYLEALKRSSIEGMLNYYKANYPREPYKNDQEFPPVKCSVLMIHGLKDQYLLPGALNDTWKWVEKDFTLVTVPGAGHFVHRDAPELVTSTMVRWLTRVDEPAGREALGRRLEQYTRPPAEFAGQFGSYRSPLKFTDGTTVRTPDDWARRRKEILETWHRRLGPWPPLVDRPAVKRLETIEREGFVQHHVHVQISEDGKLADGYLLIPDGKGPFPAVFVPFYEPQTSIGEGTKGRGTHDYGLQLVRRGFVTLSIGTPGAVEKIGLETRQLLVEAGKEQRRQPLTLLAYVAANCHTALAQMPEVDSARIGIIGLSYGGKWSMFASCLHDKFACAVWSDPGIVFDEKNANVNYWEPWYLGYDPKTQRKPGVPSAENPRTGLYKELIDAGDDMVDLHALMAPRPVLVSGGTEDPPRNWQALQHLMAVNDVLGHKQRVAMTARSTHIPTPEALDLELAFLEYWLKPTAPNQR